MHHESVYRWFREGKLPVPDALAERRQTPRTDTVTTRTTTRYTFRQTWVRPE
jgi:predicted site-specific integrase-resolvase